MFQTKRQLKRRIQALEQALEEEKELTQRSAFAKELPPVKNLACTMCKYCFRYYNGWASVYALGCLKGIDCAHFELLKPRNDDLPIFCYNAGQTQQCDESCDGIGN